MGGIFASKEEYSTLFDANKAYLKYCTSDGHMGDVDFPNGSEF